MVSRKIFFLHNLQLASTETFYEFSMTKVSFIQGVYKDMGLSSKSTSFEPKTSEQMKNRHVFKLYPEKPTKLNRNGRVQIFL
jgi:hypothetical protein